jgi:peroxiredoxin
MEMPDFQKKYMELGDEVVFLMVNMTDGARETVQSAADFVSRNGYTFPVLFDVHYDAATAYSVYSLPTTYFIDAQGNVVAKFSGAMSESVLQQYIDRIQ